MASPSTVPMIAPDGSSWDVPQANAGAAVKAGGKVAQDILGPDGSRWLIPLEQVHAALAKGGQLIGAGKPARAKQNLQPEAMTPGEQERANFATHAADSLKPENGEFFKTPIMGDERSPDVPSAAELTMAGAGGVGHQAVEAAAEGGAEFAPGLAKELAGKVMQHLRKYLGLGEKVEEAASEAASGARTAAGEAAPRTSTPAKESAEDFVNRQTKGRAQVKPNAEGKAVDATTGEPVASNGNGKRQLFGEDSEGNTIDLRTAEEKQRSVEEYFAKHPEERPKPQTWQRGPKKGQPKTYRVFDERGKWIEVPIYK